MKKIITRILIAVAVAVILSKLKLLGVMNVSALQVRSPTPSQFCVYTSSTSQSPACDTNLSTSNFFNRIWTSYNYIGTITLWNVNYQVPTPSDMLGKKVVANFIFWTNYSYFGNNPFRVYYQNGASQSFSCNVDLLEAPSQDGTISLGGRVGVVSCPEVVLQDTNMRIYFAGPFDLYGSGQLSISNVTYIHDNDLLIAQQQNNTILNNIRSDLSSTNSKLNDIISALQQQAQQQQQTNNKLQEQNDLLKNEEGVSNSDIESVLDSQDESNSPITDLVSMPLTLLNKINTGFSSSCSPFSLGTLYGEELVLPCINLSSRLGSLWAIIDIFFSIFMAYNIGMMCIRIYNNLTTLKDDSNSVYGGGN